MANIFSLTNAIDHNYLTFKSRAASQTSYLKTFPEVNSSDSWISTIAKIMMDFVITELYLPLLSISVEWPKLELMGFSSDQSIILH